MVWSDPIKNSFEVAATLSNNIESDWYPPYNNLLANLFPDTDDFLVEPQFLENPKRNRDGIDYATIFVVQWKWKPVFFIDIRVPAFFPGRNTVDRQMRRRFREFDESIPVPTFYGVSAFGTRLSIYSYDKQKTKAIQPKYIPRKLNCFNDTAPENWWAFDILQPEGEAKLLEVVDYVKQMCKEIK